jgi:hypothetical protein
MADFDSATLSGTRRRGVAAVWSRVLGGPSPVRRFAMAFAALRASSSAARAASLASVS